jgi:hypothetical protein
MLIAFRSKAGAEVLMLWPHAEAVLQALGREPATQGIFRGEQLAQALAAWRAVEDAPAESGSGDKPEDVPEPPTALRQRAWPVVDLLTRAAQHGADVTWQAL